MVLNGVQVFFVHWETLFCCKYSVFLWFLLPAFFTLGDSTVLQPPEALFGQVNGLVING
jgi:hypothetical protein